MFLRKFLQPTMVTVGLALSAFAFTACDKDDDTPATPTIASVVSNNASFSLLRNALTKAELVPTFEGAGTFTVFAPTNDAFAAIGVDQAFIDRTDKVALGSILKYHVLGSKVESGAITTADNTEVTTLNGKAFVTKNAGGVSINGAKVTTADVAASNGVIHIIDRVILPPSNDVVAALQADANYSLLVAAVVKADLVSTLKGAGPFTVFAPSNAAFEALGAPYNTAAGINGMTAAQVATLKNVLLYHVVAARVFSTNLKAGSVGTALAGKNVTIDLANGVKVVGGTTSNTASVVTSPAARFNMKATNGVIHTIDRVLLPN